MTPTRGYLFVILAGLCWGLHGAFAKFLFAGNLTPALLLQFRLTISAVLLLFYIILFKRHLLKMSLIDIPLFLPFGVIGVATNFFLYYYSIQRVHVAMAIFLQYLSPSMIALYWTLRGVKPSHTTITSILIALVGCFLVVKGYDIHFMSLNLLGVLAGLGAAVAWSCQSLFAEHFGRRYNPITMLFYSIVIAAFFWNALFSPTHLLYFPFTLRDTGGVLFVAILGTIIPSLLFYNGIAILGATRASVTATIEPIAAAVFAYFFIGELLDPPQLVGGILVIASIVVLQKRHP